MNRREFFGRLSGTMLALGSGLPAARLLVGHNGWAAAKPPVGSAGSTRRAELASTVAGPVKYPGQGATLEGYLARPATGGRYRAVILIHSKQGLDQQVREMARRYASQGRVVLAVDPLSRQGGTACFASPVAVRDAIAVVPPVQLTSDLNAARGYLQSHPSVKPTPIAITNLSHGS